MAGQYTPLQHHNTGADISALRRSSGPDAYPTVETPPRKRPEVREELQSVPEETMRAFEHEQFPVGKKIEELGLRNKDPFQRADDVPYLVVEAMARAGLDKDTFNAFPKEKKKYFYEQTVDKIKENYPDVFQVPRADGSGSRPLLEREVEAHARAIQEQQYTPDKLDDPKKLPEAIKFVNQLEEIGAVDQTAANIWRGAGEIAYTAKHLGKKPEQVTPEDIAESRVGSRSSSPYKYLRAATDIAEALGLTTTGKSLHETSTLARSVKAGVNRPIAWLLPFMDADVVDDLSYDDLEQAVRGDTIESGEAAGATMLAVGGGFGAANLASRFGMSLPKTLAVEGVAEGAIGAAVTEELGALSSDLGLVEKGGLAERFAGAVEGVGFAFLGSLLDRRTREAIGRALGKSVDEVDKDTMEGLRADLERAELEDEVDYTDLKSDIANTESELSRQVSGDTVEADKVDTPVDLQDPDELTGGGIDYAPWETGGGVPARGMLDEGDAEMDVLQRSEPPAGTIQPTETPVQSPIETPITRLTAEGKIAREMDIPVKDIVVNKDVPQFKEDADAVTGEVENSKLEGPYDPVQAGRIVVWAKADGEREVVTGRHRLALANKNKLDNIPAFVFREGDGFTKQDAHILDAEFNIRDGQGKTKDYAHYFRNADISREQAAGRGLLSRDKGRQGWALGREAVEDVYAKWANGAIGDRKAVAIARGAPNNEGAQRLGLRKAKGMSPEQLHFYTRQVANMEGVEPEGMQQGTFDELMGGSGDFARLEAEAEKVANAQAEMLKDVNERIQAANNASKKPEVARKMGIQVDDPAQTQAQVQSYRQMRDRILDPDMETMHEIRQRAGLASARSPGGVVDDPVESAPDPDSATERGAQDLFDTDNPGVADEVADYHARNYGLTGQKAKEAREYVKEAVSTAVRAKKAKYDQAQKEFDFGGQKKLDFPGQQPSEEVSRGGRGSIDVSSGDARRSIQFEERVGGRDRALSEYFENPTGEAAGRAREILRERGNISAIIPDAVAGRVELPLVGEQIDNASDFASLAVALRNPYQERFAVAVTDASGKVLNSEVLTVGQLDSSLVHQNLVQRSVHKAGSSADQVYVVHNHPGGSPDPSVADKKITRMLKVAQYPHGAKFADHIVLNGKEFYSFRQDAKLSYKLDAKQAWEVIRKDRIPVIDNAEKMHAIAAALHPQEEQAIILHTDRKNHLVGAQIASAYKDVSRLVEDILSGVSQNGTNSVLYVSKGADSKYVFELNKKLKLSGVDLLDASVEGYPSLHELGMIKEGPGHYESKVGAAGMRPSGAVFGSLGEPLVGAGIGYSLPADSEEKRMENALWGAAGGALVAHGSAKALERLAGGKAKPMRELFAIENVGEQLKNFKPAEEAVKPFKPGGSTKETIRRAAKIIGDWPDKVQTPEGSEIALKPTKNHESQADHMLREKGGQIKKGKHKFFNKVPDTLEKAQMRAYDEKTGNRVYVRKYPEGEHVVVVDTDGVIYDQGLVGDLKTQFQLKPGRRQNDFEIEWDERNGFRGGAAPGEASKDSHMRAVAEGGYAGRSYSQGDIVASESQVPDDMPGDGQALGAAQVWQKQKGGDGPVLGAVGTWVERNFTSPGGMPKAAFLKKLQMNRNLSRIAYGLKRRQMDLEKAIVQSAKEGNPVNIRRANAALAGKVPMADLPEPVRVALISMRDHTDTLSRELIQSGAVEGDVAMTIAENLGTYLHRAYRVFDDPKWSQKVPEKVRNRAKAFIRDELPNLSEDQAEGVIKNLLYRDPDGPAATMARLSDKELSIFKKRKDIPPEIRALWGEYEDPFVNYGKSVMKMAQTIEAHKFLTAVRDIGLREGWATAIPTAKHYVRVGDKGSAFAIRATKHADAVVDETAGQLRMDDVAPEEGIKMRRKPADAAKHPLSDVYVSEDMAKILNNMNELQPVTSSAWRWYLKVSGSVQAGKTVGNPVTHARNFTGNIVIVAGQGHWNLKYSREAGEAIYADFSGKGNQARVERLIQLGIMHDGIHAGSMKALLEDAEIMSGDLDKAGESIYKRLRAKHTKQALDATIKAYGAEDDFWKVFSFYSESNRYARALHGKALQDLDDVTRRKVEEYAAEIVQDTIPTYSRVPRAIKALRRTGAIGNFMSFPFEILRTSAHTLEQGVKELRNSNIKVKAIGAQRLASFAAVAVGGSYAAAGASRAIWGITQQQDEDARRFVAPWDANAHLFWLGQNDVGHLRYVSLGYQDPYSYLKQPVIAAMRAVDTGRGLDEALAEAGTQYLEPFLGERIFASSIVDALRNKEGANGYRIFNPTDGSGAKAAKILNHLRETNQPGIVSQIERLGGALTGQVRNTGRSYQLSDELFSLTGIRAKTVDVPRSISFQAKDFVSLKRDTSSSFNYKAKAWGERGSTQLSPGKLVEQYQHVLQSRMQLYQELRRSWRAAERSGLSRVEIARSLDERGLSKRDVEAISKGVFPGYMPSDETLRKINQRKGGRELIKEIYRIHSQASGKPLFREN